LIISANIRDLKIIASLFSAREENAKSEIKDKVFHNHESFAIDIKVRQ